MSWLFFALANAFFEALKDLTLKRSLHGISAAVGAWSWMAFSLPFLYTALLFSEPVTLGESFWWALPLSVTINIVAVTLYTQALQASALSVTIPMLAFIPVFLLITSPLILGEFPGPWGIVGILLVVAGSYLLNIRERTGGLLAPFKALVRERGPRLMLGVAFLWSIAGNIDKIGVLSSSPLVWSVSVFTLIALGLTFPMLRSPGSLTSIRSNWSILLLIGLFTALSIGTQMIAISMTLVAYALAIKRLSILLGVVFGALILKEEGLSEKLVGVVVMLSGVLCISLL